MAVDRDTPGAEWLSHDDVYERLVVAMETLPAAALSADTKKILNFAIAITIMLSTQAPDLLTIMANDLASKLIELRKRRGGDA